MTLTRLLDPIGMLVNIVPFAFLCFYPFSDNLRVSKRSLALIAMLFAAAVFAICYFLSPMSNQTVQIVFMSSFLCCIPAFLLTVRTGFSKQSFVFLVVANYAAFIVATSNFLTKRYFSDSIGNGGYHLSFVLLLLLLFFATMPFMLYILKRRVKPLLKLTDIGAWKTLWIIPLMFLLTFMIVKGADEADLLKSWQYPASTLTISVGSFVVY